MLLILEHVWIRIKSFLISNNYSTENSFFSSFCFVTKINKALQPTSDLKNIFASLLADSIVYYSLFLHHHGFWNKFQTDEDAFFLALPQFKIRRAFVWLSILIYTATSPKPYFLLYA